jgi:hypothetical protein
MVVPLIPPSTGGSFFPMPTGNQTGDIAYWNNGNGAWVKLDSPTGGDPNSKKVLRHNNGLEWLDLKSESGSGLPANAIAKEFDVCENGITRSYWFLVWEEEPVIEEPQEE